MKEYLLIAEKPSLMRNIKSCYEKHKSEINKQIGGIKFMSLSGHVCRYGMPDEYPEWEGKKWWEIDYPIVPSNWRIFQINDNYKMNIINNIKEVAKNVDGIIVATDSDIEGYGVYYLLEQYLGLEGMPTLRFIEHSLTDKEIYEQLLRMTDFHTDPIHMHWKDAFLLRAQADWLFGINATRIMTTKSDHTMRIGRVKAPTIKLIYDNSLAIDNFTAEKYYVVSADYGEFNSILVDDNDTPMKFKDNNEVKEYSQNGIVRKVNKERATTHAPKLFDLTAAQAEAGRAFGFSPAYTLEVIQSLYEKHKVISYPRTQCRYVSTEKANEFTEMLYNMSVFSDLDKIAKTVSAQTIEDIKNDKQVVNDKEVQKEAHDALLPTSKKPVLSEMTKDEQKICHLIYARLLQQFMPKLTEDKTTAIIMHRNDRFKATGKTVVEQGWRVLFKEAKDTYMPQLSEGQGITAHSIKPEEKSTTPPKRLTQATLVNAMKNIANLIKDNDLKKTLSDSQGIGTASTRANIISDIITSGYVDEKKGGLYITQIGKQYIEMLHDIDIISPEFAALIDMDIKKVQNGEIAFDTAYKKVLRKLKNTCDAMILVPEFNSDFQTGEKCPVCGDDIISAKFSYLCRNRSCDFKINKQICNQEINKSTLKTLLTGKATDMYEFVKKNGNSFKARLVLNDGEIGFDFSSDILCPACRDKNVIINKGGAFCDCGFKLYRKEFGAELSDEQLIDLLTKRKTDIIDSFYSKKKKESFSGILTLNEENEAQLKFPQQSA